MVLLLMTLIILFGCVSALPGSMGYGMDMTRPCYKWQHSYFHGQRFYNPESSDCIEYRCGNSEVYFHKQRCRWQDKCRDEGFTDADNSCTKYTCKPIDKDGTTVYEMQPTYKKPGTCCLKGFIYKDGKNFTAPGGSKCITYHCSNGHYTIIKEECEHNNTCIPLGISVDQECRTLNCTKIPVGSDFEYQILVTRTKKPNACCVEGTVFKDGKNFTAPGGSKCIKYHCSNGQYTIIKEGCLFRDHCHDLLDSVKDIYLENKKNKKCTKHMCIRWTKGGINIYEMRMKIGCQWRRKCLDLGDTVKKGKCKKYTCKLINKHDHIIYDMEETKTGCEVNKECYPLGATDVKRCITSTCTKSNLKFHHYEMNITEARCQDDNGNCHRKGSVGHRIKYRGQWHINCQCMAFNNGTVFYSCPY